MGSDTACALVVDDQADPLAAAVAAELERLRIAVRHIVASGLGLANLNFERDEVMFDGLRLTAVFFRAGPWTPFAEGFRADDASFASMEVSSAWLAIINRPTIAAVNRPDAELWTTRSEWAVWRRRLLAAGVPCIDLDVGSVDGEYAHWLPWGGGVASPPGEAPRRLFASALTKATGLTSSVWFAGRTYPDTRCPPELGGVLNRHGIELAGITVDDDGRMAAVTARPPVDEGTAHVLAPLIAQRLAQRVLAPA